MKNTQHWLLVLLLVVVLAGCSVSAPAPEDDALMKPESAEVREQLEAPADAMPAEPAENTGEVPGEEENASMPSGEEATIQTFTQTGSYRTPGGSHDLEITVGVEDGIVQSFDMQPVNVGNATVRGYIIKYGEGIEEQIIGKSLNDFDVPVRLNGSSLTYEGFEDAYDKVKQAASQL